MAARTIVTSHPDVACDLCGRRLLRGEQPDVFLGAGQRRMVCELCTSRATHEGWRRETEAHTPRPRPQRHQRGRSLLGGLRQLRRQTTGADPVASSARPVRAEVQGSAEGRVRAADAQWSGIDTQWANVEDEWAGTEERRADIEPAGTGPVASEADRPSGDAAAAAIGIAGGGAAVDMRRALEVFNAGEHPRRVAGVARSLGSPSVRAAPIADASATVSVVVAWELCWYRYEIDLGDEQRGAWLAGEGLELEELPAEDRVANAAADERGRLSLIEL